MKKKIVTIIVGLFCFVVFGLSFGCSNHDAAQLGAMIGRTIGKPIGTAATAVDETFRTVGDVISENPRHKRSPSVPVAVTPTAPISSDGDFYYRTEVVVKTRGPAEIQSLQLQQVEDVSEFWRD
jgi:hypothetical protein